MEDRFHQMNNPRKMKNLLTYFLADRSRMVLLSWFSPLLAICVIMLTCSSNITPLQPTFI